MTRRTALTAAGGAATVAALAPGRLLTPPLAGATTTTLAECEEGASRAAFKDFQACTETPLEYFENNTEQIELAKKALRSAKSPAERKRLRHVIEYQSAKRRQAKKELDFCNKAFYSDRAEGNAKCKAESSAVSGGTGAEPGGGGGGGNGGCEVGYALCGDYCCQSGIAFCQSCSSGPICCRVGGECCPGG
jgi:hypothetical protein